MKNLLARLKNWAGWLMKLLANFICGITRCLVPLATLAVWIGLLWSDQGRDVLRRSTERWVLDGSYSDLVFLALSCVLFSLAIWYSMRWLLLARFPGLWMAPVKMEWWRKFIPRFCGAAVPTWVGMMFWQLAHSATSAVSRAGEAGNTSLAQHAYGLAIAFMVLAGVLFSFYVKRADIFGLVVPKALPPRASVPPATQRVMLWSMIFTFLCTLLVWLYPLSVPRVVGSVSIVALALTGINLVGSFVLSFWALRHRLPNLVPAALTVAAIFSLFNDRGPSSLTEKPATAPLPVASAFEAWLAHRKDVNTIYVVAAEGGGIRAAYWTAAVLEALEEKKPNFRKEVFAISSVSGGSVGAGMWLAGLRDRLCGSDGQNIPDSSQAAVPAKAATRALGTDFLSPTLGLMFYPNLMNGFLPVEIQASDRSRGLEEGWQRAMSRLPGRPLEMNISDFQSSPPGCPAMPYALFNATVAESGQRAILSHLETEGFIDTFHVDSSVMPSYRQQSVAALMHHSARFPLVSPPGTVTDMKTGRRLARLLDGGYFDNSGIVTALELISMISKHPKAAGKNIALLVISNDSYKECPRRDGTMFCEQPAGPVSRPVVAGGSFLYEVVPLLTGVYNVRDSHIRDVLYRAVTVSHMNMKVALADANASAPLGWALSRSMTEQLDAAARRVAQRDLNFPAPAGTQTAMNKGAENAR
ncbi:patatin-like phospholipase family protein [Azohydromonas caseinilytica]|uniref:Patatin-like phospholipase family protein n=1 Tax=Azohydromonas caseinilytica TaxID=2728836 RepID=A0A848FH86_9BURK|nr:patatin-like phospholipase family protein [Azohydromonas caseinilytica]NML18838.1 patatin-like phospholipase family protein [Azohydromonas caseinilytica]